MGRGIKFDSKACTRVSAPFMACTRCADACPAGAVAFSAKTIAIADSCFDCGRCAAACPSGALAVKGFALPAGWRAPNDTVLVECERVPRAETAESALRVRCLGGLRVGDLLAWRLAAGDAPIALLDRGFCAACPAGGDERHPAAEVLVAAGALLAVMGLPAALVPQLWARPLAPALRQDPAPDALSRRDLIDRLIGGADDEAEAHEPAPPPFRPAAGARLRDLAHLRRLAARRGAALPAAFFPALAVSDACRNHGVCAALCPTGALRTQEADGCRGLSFDAAGCIACGRCESACPEGAIRLRREGSDTVPAGALVLTRHPVRQCRQCDGEFAEPGDSTRCPACRKELAYLTTIPAAAATLPARP